MDLKSTFVRVCAIAKNCLGYLVYLLFNLVFIVLAFAMYALTIPCPKIRRKIISTSLQKTLALILSILNFIGVASFKTRGRENIFKSGNAIYVANHKSLLDSIFLLSLIPNAGIVVKASYTPLLAIGVLVKLFDFVAVDKNSNDSLAKARRDCKKLLAEGVSLIIFPESTRNPGARMLEFGSLAFRLAAETKLPIVPIAILQNGTLLSKHKNAYFPNAKDSFTASFLPPITDEDSEILLNSAQRQIMRGIAKLQSEQNHDA
jgi:1-acyl-sn-glycerol-3-phosphate acyltransferase